MTKYSRSVIPGRTRDAENDLDRVVFGRAQPEADAANDDSGDEIDPVPKRRRGRRATDDFPTLPSGSGRREPPENKRAPLVLLGVVVTLGVFGVVVWNAYSNGVRDEGAAATPEVADAGPFKVRAKPAATEPTPPEQATVFERVEAAPRTAATTRTADVKPTPEVREEPAPAPVKVETAAAPAAAKPAAPAPVPVKAAPVQAAPTPAAVQAVAVKPPPLAVPAVATPAPAVAVAGAYKPAFSTGGNYLVQVAAPSTEEAAGAEWAKRAKAMPELFGAAEKYIVRADVSGRTVYRVRAGSFATTADADAFCNAIKAKGGDCFRVAK